MLPRLQAINPLCFQIFYLLSCELFWNFQSYACDQVAQTTQLISRLIDHVFHDISMVNSGFQPFALFAMLRLPRVPEPSHRIFYAYSKCHKRQTLADLLGY